MRFSANEIVFNIPTKMKIEQLLAQVPSKVVNQQR